MSGKTEETELMKIDEYAIVERGMDDIAEVVVQNLGGEELRVIDLPRIKLPTQGATQWAVPTASGVDMIDALEGIIIDHRKVKLYWVDEETLGQPPDCVAEDGRNGVGDPGGICAKCENNVFGSSSKKGSRGKACKDRKQVLFLTRDSLIPQLITLPPTSLRSFGEYMIALAGLGLPHYAVVTRVTLRTETNAANQPYAIAEFAMVAPIENEQRLQLVALSQLMKALQGGVAAEDYATGTAQ